MTAMETPVQRRLIERLAEMPGVRIVGPANADPEVRVATISFVHDRADPVTLVAAARDAGVGIRNGHMYAHRLCTAMSIEPEPGVVRISAVHYNEVAEADRACDAIERAIAASI
jgi:selenocysteine lyase/cysteine desulfurase